MPSAGITGGTIVRNSGYSQSGFTVSGNIHGTATGRTPSTPGAYLIRYLFWRYTEFDYDKITHHVNPPGDPGVDPLEDQLDAQLIGTQYGTATYGASTDFSSTSGNQSINYDFAAAFAIEHPDDPTSTEHDYTTYILNDVSYQYAMTVDIVAGNPLTPQVPSYTTAESTWSTLPP